MKEVVLSEVELERICVLEQVRKRLINGKEASQQLGISSRQVRRLLRRLESGGAEGIKRKPSGGNRAFAVSFKTEVVSAVKRTYPDFGPTFAAEKLEEREGLKVNRETLRQWMIEAEIWKGRKRRQHRIHQSRERRPRFGELIQIDGSHHDWFEGRAPKCCLYVFIDDATSRIVAMRFEASETTQDTFGASMPISLHMGVLWLIIAIDTAFLSQRDPTVRLGDSIIRSFTALFVIWELN